MIPAMYAPRSASSSSSRSVAGNKLPRYRCDHGAIHPPVPIPVPPEAAGMRASYSCANPSPCMSKKTSLGMGQKILSEPLRGPSTEVMMVYPRLDDPYALNYSSSGSLHDPSTICLAAMVHGFLEEDDRTGTCGRARCNCVDGVCGNDEDVCATLEKNHEAHTLAEENVYEILEGVSSCASDPELHLLLDVARAVEAELELMPLHEDECRSINRNLLKRSVMHRLRQIGHNAAICKSRWKHSDGLPAGDYEYIDIVIDAPKQGSKPKQDRFIVDIDFKAQFEIARASKYYSKLLNVLPKLFVGKAERLKQVLKIMSNAAKDSLQEQGLLLPPWRKYKYLQAKWLSSYRRTTNPESLHSSEKVLDSSVRIPKNLSINITKDMGLLFHNQHVRFQSSIHKQDQPFIRKRELAGLACGSTAGSVTTVASGGSAQNLPKRMSSGPTSHTTGMCTGWQLPSLDFETCRGNKYKVSGISTAIRQPDISLPLLQTIS
ncbi:hypothetical protein KP509_1Z089200 [Ceratopteris richardii]|nr:hypothetical protein KP509_1Z089200 [Ceratopteris richardii]